MAPDHKKKKFRDSTGDRTSDLWSSIWSSISGSKPETPALYSVRYMYMLFLNILQYTQFYQLLPNHILTKANWLCGEKRNYSLNSAVFNSYSSQRPHRLHNHSVRIHFIMQFISSWDTHRPTEEFHLLRFWTCYILVC
jgi:hypothetical protein